MIKTTSIESVGQHTVVLPGFLFGIRFQDASW